MAGSGREIMPGLSGALLPSIAWFESSTCRGARSTVRRALQPLDSGNARSHGEPDSVRVVNTGVDPLVDERKPALHPELGFRTHFRLLPGGCRNGTVLIFAGNSLRTHAIAITYEHRFVVNVCFRIGVGGR
jgi:hypothetical protein